MFFFLIHGIDDERRTTLIRGFAAGEDEDAATKYARECAATENVEIIDIRELINTEPEAWNGLPGDTERAVKAAEGTSSYEVFRYGFELICDCVRLDESIPPEDVGEDVMGAYANIFTLAATREEACSFAIEELEDFGWSVVEWESVLRTPLSEWLDPENELSTAVLQALIDGTTYVFNVYGAEESELDNRVAPFVLIVARGFDDEGNAVVVRCFAPGTEGLQAERVLLNLAEDAGIEIDKVVDRVGQDAADWDEHPDASIAMDAANGVPTLETWHRGYLMSAKCKSTSDEAMFDLTVVLAWIFDRDLDTAIARFHANVAVADFEVDEWIRQDEVNAASWFDDLDTVQYALEAMLYRQCFAYYEREAE